MRTLTLATALVGMLAFLAPSPAFSQKNEDCLTCHSDETLVREYADGRKVSVYIDKAALEGSVHLDLGCVDCHQDLSGAKDYPHAEEVANVQCGTCHDSEKAEHDKSVHGAGLARGETDPARCRDCHGTHFILPKSDPRSSVYHLKLPNTCGRCHDDPTLIKRHPGMPRVFQNYSESIHGKAVMKYGLMMAAVCSDCHGVHDISRKSDPKSKINRANISSVCGGCHPSAIAAYRQGIHGIVSAEGKSEPAVCIDCHGEHSIRAPTDRSSSVYVSRIVETCSKCHANKEVVGKFGVSTSRVATYQESVHGLGTMYGSTVVANCVSCHKYHDIKPASDPSSSINPGNLKETCGQARCHLGATDRFVGGAVHVSFSRPDEWLLRLIRIAYVLIIGATIGGMIVHNAIDYMGRRRHAAHD